MTERYREEMPPPEAARARLSEDKVLRLNADEDYPELLRSIPDPPHMLHVRGRLKPGADALAIVGSRRPTPYGRRMARSLARECAQAGLVVVSGLARGIDTEAHEAALDAGGVTWAVLGSGLGRIYPKENEELAERVAQSGGAVLSEFPQDTGPLACHFPRRNRIISGLSWGVIVVEGDLKSGALITARCALSQGREVFAVPGPADSAMSEGPLDLIRQGAAMICRLEDALCELPSLRRSSAPAAANGKNYHLSYNGSVETELCSALNDDEGKIMSLLAGGSLSLEELADGTGWDAPGLIRALSELEGRGLISSVPGQRYART
ncbi:MAG: DNA-protecting protein DprA [Elusimicrobia bacterium]|nr:DNA-protecting protein DprA [Elusimicrobiota bacterium]